MRKFSRPDSSARRSGRSPTSRGTPRRRLGCSCRSSGAARRGDRDPSTSVRQEREVVRLVRADGLRHTEDVGRRGSGRLGDGRPRRGLGLFTRLHDADTGGTAPGFASSKVQDDAAAFASAFASALVSVFASARFASVFAGGFASTFDGLGDEPLSQAASVIREESSERDALALHEVASIANSAAPCHARSADAHRDRSRRNQDSRSSRSPTTAARFCAGA